MFIMNLWAKKPKTKKTIPMIYVVKKLNPKLLAKKKRNKES